MANDNNDRQEFTIETDEDMERVLQVFADKLHDQGLTQQQIQEAQDGLRQLLTSIEQGLKDQQDQLNDFLQRPKYGMKVTI